MFRAHHTLVPVVLLLLLGCAPGGGGTPADETSSVVTGVVLATDGSPLAGVQAYIRDAGVFATTDARGQFRLTQVPLGRQHLVIVGTTALDPRVLPCLIFEILVEPGVDSGLRKPVYLPPLDMARGVTLSLDADGFLLQGAVVESAPLPNGDPGMQLEIPAGTKVTFADGVPGPITLSPIPFNRVPMALGEGLGSLTYFTVQPSDVHFDPPARIAYANAAGLPPGGQVEMMSFDHDVGRYVSRGPGEVTGDGRFIRSLPGAGVTKGGWHAPGFRVEPVVVEGRVDDCDGMKAFHVAAATARQARADAQNALNQMIFRASDLAKDYVKGKVKSRVKKWLQTQALAAAGLLETGGVASAILEIKSAIDAIDGFFEDVADATLLIDDVVRDVGVYTVLARIADQTNEKARQAAAAIDPLNCLAESQALHAQAQALFDEADLAEQIAAMEDERGLLRDQQGNLLSYVEAAKLARAKLQQIVDNPPATLQEARLAALTIEEALLLLGETEATGGQIDGDLDATAAALDAQALRLEAFRAENAAYISAVGALFQATTPEVSASDGTPTQVGQVGVISRVAGVSVLAGGITGFTDATGHFTLRGVPGIQVNLADGSRTPLPISVDVDDSALEGLRTDTDGDAIPDDWELRHGLDPRDPDDALLDVDGDGLTALAEYAGYADPQSADTDGDGVSDLDELAAGGDPGFAPRADALELFTVSPNVGRPGQAVTLRGAGFGGDAAAIFVTFDGIPATVTYASAWRVDALVPEGVRTGPVVVNVGGVDSNPVAFTAGAMARNLSEFPSFWVASPCVELGADQRNVYVAWVRGDGAAIVLRRSGDGGGSFSGLETLSRSSTDPLTTQERYGAPWLAAGSDGSVAAVWTQWRKTNGVDTIEVELALAASGGAFAEPMALAFPPSGIAPANLVGSQARVALDGAGGVFLLLPANFRGSSAVWLARSLDGGATFGEWQKLSAQPTNSGYYTFSEPNLVVAGDGSLTVAWVQNAFSFSLEYLGSGDQTRHSADRGATFGSPAQILSDVLAFGSGAALSLGADGARVFCLQTLGVGFFIPSGLLTVSTDYGATIARPFDTVAYPTAKSDRVELGVGAGGQVSALLVVAGTQIVANRYVHDQALQALGPLSLPVSQGGGIRTGAGCARIAADGTHHVVWTDVVDEDGLRDVFYVGTAGP